MLIQDVKDTGRENMNRPRMFLCVLPLIILLELISIFHLSSPIKLFSSSSNGGRRALLATISSFSFALSASFSSLELEWEWAMEEKASYSSLMASQSIDSIGLGSTAFILKKETW
ncbi:hypothetical protein NQ315_011963 [Exocentrus adspersus]|uniref:Uncharacterized protein n=1 Tax=Exocentrus adspersus TaxID=1586481 RepID=A0AAV8W2C7_9CUCU|nr:hypothetical protein NQ315_011963 [Exocentrus adspersus]